MNYSDNNQLDLIKITEDYFERVLQEIKGIKCLILDEETTGIISLICSQSQILKKDVYLIEKIDNNLEEKLLHLKALFFIRPTEQNFSLLREHIQNPKFQELHIFFSNQVPNTEIEKLAEIDENDIIKTVQEVYSDYYTINKDLFTLNISSTFGLTRQVTQWTPQDYMILKRIKDGLLSAIYSLRRVPMIRYLHKSQACQSIAEELSNRIDKEVRQNNSQFHRDSKTLLLIIDRREDPVTPLLNQWTYQAMLHELIGVHNNRVDLINGLKALNPQGNQYQIQQQQDPEKQFVISPQNDSFFQQNMFVNFGELAQNIKDFIDEVQRKRQSTMKLDSLEDMAKAVENIPELKRISGNLSKHVTLSMEVSKLVEERQLMTVSRVEQELVSKDDKSYLQKSVWEVLNDPNIQNLEKLKVVILYALRYENCEKIEHMKDKLRQQGFQQKNLNLINYAVDYAGKKQRQGDLFQTKNWKAIMKRKLKVFDNCPNVFTQHEPYIMNLLNQIKENKLKEQEYPVTSLNYFKGQPQEIIIFMVGGCTYEEAEKINEYSKQMGTKIVLGGSYIHNSKTFLAELSQMAYQNQDQQTININQ